MRSRCGSLAWNSYTKVYHACTVQYRCIGTPQVYHMCIGTYVHRMCASLPPQVLFATETFAMGVNAPARTVRPIPPLSPAGALHYQPMHQCLPLCTEKRHAGG